jgi:polysaccharide deacetylase family protein (PEP-CTERM system associated)
VFHRRVDSDEKHPTWRLNPCAAASDRPIKNILTVDLEEYFTIQGLQGCVSRSAWDEYPMRSEAQTRALLALFDRYDAKVTFFVLGWLAERRPDLIRQIRACGHEIALHSYWHMQVHEMSPNGFRDDLRKGRAVLEEITGDAIVGYRAPTYSITRDSLWAHEILEEEGFVYSSSIFPIHHDRYGIPEYSRYPQRVGTSTKGLWELPLTTYRCLGQNVPIAGGGYMRLLPVRLLTLALREFNRRESLPFILYMHPWEIDPNIPRFRQGWLKDRRTYAGLDTMLGKVEHLLKRFAFRRMIDWVQELDASDGQ